MWGGRCVSRVYPRGTESQRHWRLNIQRVRIQASHVRKIHDIEDSYGSRKHFVVTESLKFWTINGCGNKLDVRDSDGLFEASTISVLSTRSRDNRYGESGRYDGGQNGFLKWDRKTIENKGTADENNCTEKNKTICHRSRKVCSSPTHKMKMTF